MMSNEQLGSANSGVSHLNLAYIGIVLVFMEFSVLVFPLIERFYAQAGLELPLFTQIGFVQCLMAATHPVAALSLFAAGYAALQTVGHAGLSKMVNAILLTNYAAVIGVLGLPILHMMPPMMR